MYLYERISCTYYRRYDDVTITNAAIVDTAKSNDYTDSVYLKNTRVPFPSASSVGSPFRT